MNREDAVIIWVVGDNTNVGKTTISAALIRALNAEGRATIGFKPYAGARLIDVLDLLADDAAVDGFLVGRDARKLAKESLLIPDQWLEVVNPSWRVSHPSRDVAVLLRKGSVAINSRSLFHTDNANSLWSRADFKQLNQLMQLPVEEFKVIPNKSADHLDYSGQNVQLTSFKLLLTLGPEIVVCEGAGRLLPVWEAAPPARHLCLISAGYLYLFPNLRLRVSEAQSTFGPYTTGAIVRQLNGLAHKPCLSMKYISKFNGTMT
jgi:hypothetical protein